MEKFVTVQFIAPEEIAHNGAEFYRLQAKFYDVCSDILNTRADIKEFAQAIRKKEKELV
ncbi:MAG: hypothetical protein M3T96_08985 [Acidobacteriota bacterium]|nr:hypothetical protein [Acidobacteriota bacterium]